MERRRQRSSIRRRFSAARESLEHVPGRALNLGFEIVQALRTVRDRRLESQQQRARRWLETEFAQQFEQGAGRCPLGQGRRQHALDERLVDQSSRQVSGFRAQTLQRLAQGRRIVGMPGAPGRFHERTVLQARRLPLKKGSKRGVPLAGPSIDLDCFVGSVLLLQQLTEFHASPTRYFRIEFDRPAEGRLGFIEALELVGEQVAQVAPRQGIPRIEFDRPAVGRLSFVEALELVGEQETQVVPRPGIRWIEFDRPAEGCLGFVEALELVSEQDAQVVPRPGIRRIEFDRPAVGPHRR